MATDQKARNLTQIFWRPLGRFDFPLGYPWLMHRKQHNREENSANPKLALRGRHCAFPLKCGQIIKTTAGHLMTMGALEPSCSIIEQANRWQWLLSIMVQHMPSIRVPPPSVPCAMPSWTIACRVWHCTAPWHALPMRIPYTYEQGSCDLTCTYTGL